MCEKVKYKKKSTALAAGLHFVSQGIWKTRIYRAYYCGKCRAWHLTSRRDLHN